MLPGAPASAASPECRVSPFRHEVVEDKRNLLALCGGSPSSSMPKCTFRVGLLQGRWLLHTIGYISRCIGGRQNMRGPAKYLKCIDMDAAGLHHAPAFRAYHVHVYHEEPCNGGVSAQAIVLRKPNLLINMAC